MKIHSTQNLNLRQNQQLSNVSENRDFRLKNYSEQVGQDMSDLFKYSSTLTFGHKGPVIRNGKKVIKSAAKKVGEIAEKANPEVKGGAKLSKSSFFNGILDGVGYETLVTAGVAAIACAARAGTIVAIPTKKNKEDNNYAAGQAAASGIIGFITAFVLTAPFKAGADYVMKEMRRNLSAKTLKRLYPHVDLNSIEKDGKRLPIKEWLDTSKNSFIDDMKECERLPKFKNLAEVSDETYKKILKVDVDWPSQKDKSFNDVVLKDGRKLYDVINMDRLGITVEEEGMSECQILLKDINRVYFERFLECAREDKTYWSTLDVKSVYNDAGKVKDFREWKDVKGNQWKLNLDEIGISSPYETAEYRNRISGSKRFDNKDNEYKFVTYQNNGKDGELGTEITNKMVDADRANDGLIKFLTWLPDLLFRVPVAAATVAIIPWVMKNVLHLSKSSDTKKADTKNNIQKETVPEKNNKKAVSFKAKSNIRFLDGVTQFFQKYVLNPIGKFFGNLYGRHLIESEAFYNISQKISKLPGDVTEHMSALGSLITSSVYVHQTLTKKDIEHDRRRTLAVNQGLCFVVPTIAAYKVNKFINSWVKKRGYDYSGANHQAMDIAKLEGKKAPISPEKLGKRLKGIRTLASITVFTLIYRYATPVLITPLANMLGDKWNANIAEKKKARLAAEKLAEDKKAA